MVKVENAPHLPTVDAEAFAQLRLGHGLFAHRRMNRQLDRHPGRHGDHRLGALGLGGDRQCSLNAPQTRVDLLANIVQKLRGVIRIPMYRHCRLLAVQLDQLPSRRSHAFRISSSIHINAAPASASSQTLASMGAVPNSQWPAGV